MVAAGRLALPRLSRFELGPSADSGLTTRRSEGVGAVGLAPTKPRVSRAAAVLFALRSRPGVATFGSILRREGIAPSPWVSKTLVLSVTPTAREKMVGLEGLAPPRDRSHRVLNAARLLLRHRPKRKTGRFDRTCTCTPAGAPPSQDGSSAGFDTKRLIQKKACAMSVLPRLIRFGRPAP